MMQFQLSRGFRMVSRSKYSQFTSISSFSSLKNQNYKQLQQIVNFSAIKNNKNNNTDGGGGGNEESEGGIVAYIKNIFHNIHQYRVNQQLKKDEKFLNTMIENSMRGVGLFGGIVGYVVRTLLKLTTKIDATIINDMNTDISFIQAEIVKILLNNRQVVKMLGESVSCDLPYHMSSNTTNINGVVRKRFQLRMSVNGSITSAVVSVDATIHDGELYLNSILLQKNMTTLDIDCSGKPIKKPIVIDA